MTRTCDNVYSDLPAIPLAGDKVANELENLCLTHASCENINTWLNELYLFKLQYEIYRTESVSNKN